MQEYKLFSRAVWPGENQFGSNGEVILSNLDETLEYLNGTYLASGYKVLHVEKLREVVLNPTDPQSPQGFQFAWHLVKDTEPKSKKQDV